MSARDVVILRAHHLHLAAQVEAGIDTNHASLSTATDLLAKVEEALHRAEDEMRGTPEGSYLFKVTRGKNRPAPAGEHEPEPTPIDTSTKEDGMAKSKAARLEDIITELKKTEKILGSTRWALTGAGAAKNPPSDDRKKVLETKVAALEGIVAELRAKRDELKG